MKSMINSRSSRPSSRRGFTIVEALVSAILLVLLFMVAFRALSTARQEAMKGFWLQEQIIALRNTTRTITQCIKTTSYPTTLVKSNAEELLFSYKEMRTFDGSGRLRELTVKADDSMDMHLLSGFVSPDEKPQRIMYFPACTPELDLGNYTPGLITWYEFILEPDPNNFAYARLGRVRLIEREEPYNTTSNPSRAFGLVTSFKSDLPVKREKVLIQNVSNIFVSHFSVDELRGIAVTESGQIDKQMRRRHLVSVRIECSHPRDERMQIGDQCSIVNNIDVSELMGSGMTLVVLKVTGSSALVRLNGAEQTVAAGSSLSSQMSVKSVFSGSGSSPGGIRVTLKPSGKTQIFYEKK